jgi:hypothetical protein
MPHGASYEIVASCVRIAAKRCSFSAWDSNYRRDSEPHKLPKCSDDFGP